MYKKTVLATLSAALLLPAHAQQQKRTVLEAQVYGTQQEMVYFDCLQTPMVKAEFHNNPGEDFHYAFTTDFSPMVMLVNGKTQVLMNSGDSLHVVVRYEGNKRNVQWSGSERTVAANRLAQEVSNVCRRLNYKTQLLSCAALGITPKARIDSARLMLAEVGRLADKYKGKADPQLVAYIQAVQEASAWMSMIEYPPMYEEIRHQPISEQGIGNYWTLMDGVSLRDDDAAMSCPDYGAMLIRYSLYAQEREARKAGKGYERPGKLEGIFNAVKATYTGRQREFALYTLLCNFIRNGKEVERALPLYKEYKEAFHPQKVYTDVLDQLLQ
jgi:hypothetical protein